MAALSLPPMDLLQRSAAVLAANAAGNTPRINALNKAAYHFGTGHVELVETFGGLLITSATRPGTVHRVDNVAGCSCEAGARGRACWHTAAVEILEDAQRYTMPALQPRPRSAAAARAFAEMDELYG